jgi:hypothetical protein
MSREGVESSRVDRERERGGVEELLAFSKSGRTRHQAEPKREFHGSSGENDKEATILLGQAEDRSKMNDG